MALRILNFVFITKAAIPGVYWINQNAVTERKFHAPHKAGPNEWAIPDERRRPWYLFTLFKDEQ